MRYAGGVRETRAIVLLHEGLGSVSLWRDFPQRLAERTGCEVIAYSRFGYGRSEPFDAPREPSYLHDEASRGLPALLESLDIVRPILFGHSDGASIAVLFASLRPAAVDALILEAPHVFLEDVTVDGVVRARTAFAQTDLRERLARHHADPDATFHGWNDIWLDPRFRDWNIETHARNVLAPTLQMQGADDEYGTIAQLRAIVAERNARTIVFERCGHAPHRERTEDVLDEVERFIRERAARR